MMSSTWHSCSSDNVLVSAPASSASTSSTRKHVVRHAGSSPPWQPRIWSFTLEVSELPLHLQVLEEVVEAGRILHGEPVIAEHHQPRAIQPIQHEPDGGLAHAELPGQLAQGQIDLHPFIGG